MKKMAIMMMLVLSVSAIAEYDYTISSGYFYSLTLKNSQTFLMTGGGGDLLTCKDYSVAEIKNTSSPLAVDVGGIWDLRLGGYSKTTISGGEINWIDLLGNATMIISGGKINNLQSGQLIETGFIKHIEVICKAGYQYNTTTKKLTGVWGDNSAFTIQLWNDPESRPTIDNIKFTIIPEPMTLALLALGGLLMRRK